MKTFIVWAKVTTYNGYYVYAETAYTPEQAIRIFNNGYDLSDPDIEGDISYKIEDVEEKMP